MSEATVTDPRPDAEEMPAPKRGNILGQAGAALAHREFRLLSIGQALANTGYWALVVAIGWLALDLSGSKFVLTVASASLSLPFLLIGLPAGVIADRADRQLLLTLTRCFLVVLMVLLSALTFAGLITIPLLIVIAFAAGCVFAMDLPTRQSLVPELVEPHQVTNAIALNQMIFTGTTILGPVLGGLLIEPIGAGGAFALAALGNVALVIMIRQMRFPARAPRTGNRSVIQDLRQGLGFVLGHPVLQGLVALSAGIAILGQPYQSLLPALAKEPLHLADGSLGILYIPSGIGAIAGTLIVGTLGDRSRRGLLLLSGPFLFAAMLVGISLSRSLPLTLALLTGIGVAGAVGGTMTSTIMVTTAPVELRGRVMSINILIFGMSPLGGMLLGALADALDVPAALKISGLALLAVVSFTAATRPRLRSL